MKMFLTCISEQIVRAQILNVFSQNADPEQNETDTNDSDKRNNVAKLQEEVSRRDRFA